MSTIRRSFLSILLFSLCPSLLAAQDVTITAPQHHQAVFDVVSVEGNTAELDASRVAISIDGGPFLPAEGTATWSFEWPTSDLPDGEHTITARARACTTCPAVFDSISVMVANGQLSVAFLFPEDGAEVLDTLVVTGTSSEAETVGLAVDDGLFQPANGLAPWTVVLEPGSLSPGLHTLTARASGAGDAEVKASISIDVGAAPPGVQAFTYLSSVDGEPMGGSFYVGAGASRRASFDVASAHEPTALVVHLHGGGGIGVISPAMQEALDAKGWIGIAPDGRQWGLHDPDDSESCPWRTSAAYVDSPDPDVGPGEQDIFDAITWAQNAFDIDPDRIYLQGFSMGGRGTYAIGLKNPDFFAAIAPLGPAIDMYELFVRRPEPAACKEGMVGGEPGDSPEVDTFYSITSGRFLIENAYNLPVFHGHGTLDTVANNVPDHAPFLHGWHITDDGGWSDCHGETELCFGHTPTLAELSALHSDDPAAYPWAFFFSPVAHVTDPRWLLGGEKAAGDFGVANPDSPGDWLGIYDFFASHRRVSSPQRVVFKSYTDTHRRAYWLDLLISTPWENRPGAVRALSNPAENRLTLEMVRVAELRVNLGQAGLGLGTEMLTLDLDELIEPAYDPALLAPGESLEPMIVLEGDFSSLSGLDVLQDGAPLAPGLLSWDGQAITLGPLSLESATSLELIPVGALFADGFESGNTAAWSSAAPGEGAVQAAGFSTTSAESQDPRE